MAKQPRKRKPKTSVETIRELTNGDLHELCDATEAAIESGGGFGWLQPPPRKTLQDYWRGVLMVPELELIVGRVDAVIASSCQLVRPPRNNEAQRFICRLTTFFVAPWARGNGLATLLLEEAEAFARTEGFKMINLDVRSTQTDAIQRYEAAGYTRFGSHPKYAIVQGDYVDGYYYYKEVE